MLHHTGFNKLAFTGSTEIGRKIGVAAAEMLIPSTLELGGKSANIFFDDMPFDKALEGAQKGILFNQGQVCCAGSRIFVQESVYDKFIAALKEEFKKVKVGLPWEDDTQMGAQVNGNQVKVISKYVDIAKEEGCQIVVGGGKSTDPALARGEFGSLFSNSHLLSTSIGTTFCPYCSTKSNSTVSFPISQYRGGLSSSGQLVILSFLSIG